METKNPIDGITFHGVPLEEKLKLEKDQESSRQFKQEVIEKKNLMVPIHCKPKYKESKAGN